LLGVAVLVVVIGVQLRNWYHVSGSEGCPRRRARATVTAAFASHYSWLPTVLGGVLIPCADLVIG